MTECIVAIYKYWCRYRTVGEWQVWRDSGWRYDRYLEKL